MFSKRVVATVLLCFVLVCLLSAFVQPAFAQSGDQNLAEKKGIEGLFKGKGVAKDDPRLATPLQKYAGWGSFVVMIIVVKYL
ncbi:MAG: hypothetical protein IT365_07285 [Candidatus Hydrogenedentes bacterium]|nr:hypothetical protein [Candidatus Hydrogenedentota bacterium]